jgi:hypothetical protein
MGILLGGVQPSIARVNRAGMPVVGTAGVPLVGVAGVRHDTRTMATEESR